MTEQAPKTKRAATVYIIQRVVKNENSTAIMLEQSPVGFQSVKLAEEEVSKLATQSGDEYQIVNVRRSCVVKTSPVWD